MTILGNNRPVVALKVAVVLLIVLYGILFGYYGWLKIHVSLASEQTEIFESMRAEALKSNTVGAAENLRYVINYYPSGSKQETGSRLDKMVERERASAVRDIIAYLNAKTGEDLGGDPAKWIQKYGNVQ